MSIVEKIAALEAKMGKAALRAAIYQLRSPHGVIIKSQAAAINEIYAREVGS